MQIVLTVEEVALILVVGGGTVRESITVRPVLVMTEVVS